MSYRLAGRETQAMLEIDRDFPGPEYQFLTDSQEVTATLRDIGEPDDGTYASLFVLASDGDYDEIWGCESNVPRYGAHVYRLL